MRFAMRPMTFFSRAGGRRIRRPLAAPILLLVALGVPSAVAALPEGATPGKASGYAWPLALAPRVSATFGEYRPGHFHAGVDLSTSGRDGIPVVAVDDGEVVRVRASGVGYGRAIYVRLRNGRLAVYAHLSAFMEPLARYVEAAQDSLGRYRVDLNPPPGRFPVARGQTIGKSGSSGQGPAHFHFELRDGDIALNPLTHGFATADARGPVLTALHVTPLAADARVNGAARKLRVPLRVLASGELAADGEIRIQGRVAVAVQGYDQDGDPGNYLGIYRTELLVNGVRRAVTCYERFDYLRNHEVEAEYDFEEARAGRRTVQNLFVPPGVTGDFHGGLAPWSGVLVGAGTDSGAPAAGSALVLGPGLHRLRVVATDAFGNVTAAEATVRVEKGGAVANGRGTEEPTLAGSAWPASGPPAARPTWTLAPATRVATLTLDFDAAPARAPWLLVPGASAPLPATAASPTRYTARFDARGQSPLVLRIPAAAGGFVEESIAPSWCPVPRAAAGRLTALDGRVLLEFGAGAFFEDAYLWAGADSSPSRLPAGLEPVGPVFRVEPVGLPLDQGVWVGAAPGAGTERGQIALYRIDGAEVDYMGAEWRGGHLGAAAHRLAIFVLARDTRPPAVNFLSPADSVVAPGGRPLLRARVRDLESGFREDDLTFTIDGRRVPSEWNPDAGDLCYRPRMPLASGRHVLVAEATDRAGNVTRRTLNLRVR